jgi:hypothetical protein
LQSADLVVELPDAPAHQRLPHLRVGGEHDADLVQ